MKGAKRSEGLGIFAAIAFAMGNMIGAGVFVLSGILIDLAGPSAVLSYILCGVLVTFSGLSYAALASIFPEDGGGYLYAKHMLGEYPGFLAGFGATTWDLKPFAYTFNCNEIVVFWAVSVWI